MIVYVILAQEKKRKERLVAIKARKPKARERTYGPNKLFLCLTHLAMRALSYYTIYLPPICKPVLGMPTLTVIGKCLTDNFQGIQANLAIYNIKWVTDIPNHRAT